MTNDAKQAVYEIKSDSVNITLLVKETETEDAHTTGSEEITFPWLSQRVDSDVSRFNYPWSKCVVKSFDIFWYRSLRCSNWKLYFSVQFRTLAKQVIFQKDTFNRYPCYAWLEVSAVSMKAK